MTQRASFPPRMDAPVCRVATVSSSAGRFGKEQNDSIRFDDNFDSIRFDKTVYCLLAFAWTHLHHHMASSTMAMLILFVVSNFCAHINRILNAGFLVEKTLAKYT